MKLLQKYWLELLQASGLPVFRQAGGVATCAAHSAGNGAGPLLLGQHLQAGVAGRVQGVEQHPTVPLQSIGRKELSGNAGVGSCRG